MNRLPFPRSLTALVAASLLAFATVQAHADAGSLRGKYTEVREQMRNNNYGRPLHIDSAEGSNTLQGDVYAVLDHPFERVSSALQDPNAWCDIMMLPFNTKACRADGQKLAVRIGRKHNQPVDQAYPIAFSFSNVSATSSYMQARLMAPEGPISTRDYRIDVEAIPLDAGKTFLHMSYSYGFGAAGRFAMQAYLATVGADKVGFTANGVRGAVERNAMRYYLAIDAYLDTMDTPAPQRVDRRIERWFAASERYPKQLREMDRDTYVSMKREEYGRQQTAAITR